MLSKDLGLSDVITEHLNGILRVVQNDPVNNKTGLTFSACKWYHKRYPDTLFMPMPMDGSPLYYTAGPSLSDRFTEKDSMYLVLTLSDGTTLKTCPDADSVESGGGNAGSAGKKSSRIAASPNPVTSGGFIKLKQSDFADGKEEEERYVKYSLFSSQGRLILCGEASPLYEGQGLAMPLVPAGIYHLLLEGKSGKRWVAKVAIEN